MGSVIQRVVAEARFFGNMLLEAALHPMSTSIVSKTSGAVVSRTSPSAPPNGTSIHDRLQRIRILQKMLVESLHLRELLSFFAKPVLHALDYYKNLKERKKRRQFAAIIDASLGLILEHGILGYAIEDVERIAEVRFSHKLATGKAKMVEFPKKEGYQVLVHGLNVDDTDAVVWKVVERFIYCEQIASRMEEDTTMAQSWPWVMFLQMCESSELQDLMGFSLTTNFKRRTTSRIRRAVEGIQESVRYRAESPGVMALSIPEKIILQHNLSMIGQFGNGLGGRD